MEEETTVIENTNTSVEEKNTSLATVDELSIEEIQLSDQIYHGAGLDPIVDAGIKDYENKIEQENKLFNKILGVRGTDVRGYGESVAKRVAVAVYGQLSKQYGGKVGDLRAYIMNLEEERDNANRRYDDLMGRAIGILGEEYKELKTDSNEFMQKLTEVMGEDLKASRINSEALTEKLADMDGLRSQLRTLMKDKEDLIETSAKEKEQLKDKYQSQITDLANKHKTEINNLSDKFESQLTEVINQNKAEIRDLNLRINTLDKEKELLADASNKEKEQLEERFEQQIASLNNEHKVEIRNLNEKYESQINEIKNQHKAEIQDLNIRIDALGKEKEILADTSAKEKEQLKERFEQQIVSINNEHKVEIRNLTEKYETQINELHNEYKAEIRKLSSRVEILAKEKDLQKEQYESQIADLDSTIRGLGSRKSESQNGDETFSTEDSES
ncbi:MAG: hypothetical protein JSU79_06470 [Dehalococcoidales bacterium]|nr:MAG: hypothetical protein JSU79_06470 [Dehalococcoidales bacterium]